LTAFFPKPSSLLFFLYLAGAVATVLTNIVVAMSSPSIADAFWAAPPIAR
jgi:hypothetical protein